MTDEPLICPPLVLPASPVITVTPPDRSDVDKGFILAHGLNGCALVREVTVEFIVATRVWGQLAHIFVDQEAGSVC